MSFSETQVVIAAQCAHDMLRHLMQHIHTHSARFYGDSAYDNYFSLKPSRTLWLAVWFLSRTITLPLIMGAAHVAGVNDEALRLMRELWSFDVSMIPAVPAAAVLYLFIRRVPTASRAVRWAWSRGKVLLLISAMLDVAANFARLPRDGVFNDLSVISCMSIAIDLVIIGYGMMSRRVRDTFADFPMTAEP